MVLERGKGKKNRGREIIGEGERLVYILLI